MANWVSKDAQCSAVKLEFEELGSHVNEASAIAARVTDPPDASIEFRILGSKVATAQFPLLQ